jgi:hypothetical protein
MTKTPTRTQLSNKVVEIARASNIVTRRVNVDDLPRDLAHCEGGQEAAVLTLAARSHDFEFDAVMTALEKLSKLTDWSHPFMVADSAVGKRPYFDWRDAPLRHYKSFKDFYQRELETTWGKWEDLQHTWARIVEGEITEEEGRHIILRGRGRPRKDGDEKDVTSFLKRSEMNTKAHIIARLDRDRPDLAARVRAKTMSANAAAIEAGFRKRTERKKLTALQRAIKAVAKLTNSEWHHLRREEDARRRAPARQPNGKLPLA